VRLTNNGRAALLEYRDTLLTALAPVAELDASEETS
jgi:hypothetical protein